MVRDGYFYGGGCLLAAGVIVLTPTVAVLPEPDWNNTELPRTELLVMTL